MDRPAATTTLVRVTDCGSFSAAARQLTKEAANHVPHGCPEMPIVPGNLGVSSGRMAEL